MIEVHFESNTEDQERHYDICVWCDRYAKNFRVMRRSDYFHVRRIYIFGASMDAETLTGFILKFNPKIVKTIPKYEYKVETCSKMSRSDSESKMSILCENPR